MAMVTRFFVLTCPFPDECSKTSWAKTKYCESYESEDEVRSNLHRHLTKCSLHWHNDPDLVKDIVDTAEVDEEQVPAHYAEHRPTANGRDVDHAVDRLHTGERPSKSPRMVLCDEQAIAAVGKANIEAFAKASMEADRA